MGFRRHRITFAVGGLLLVGLVVTARAVAGDLAQTFSWERAPTAKYPYARAEGNLYYQIIPSLSEKLLPLRRCLLIHGYGITQGFLDFLIYSQGPGARLSRLLAQLQGKTAVRAFADGYYGGPFLADRLLDEVCEEVVISVQESTQSSAWEMTERTEAFLTDRGCPGDLKITYRGQKKCALIGHSRGGEVVSLITERCAEQNGMPREICRGLEEVYTASSVAGGVGVSAVVLGARLAGEESLASRFLDKLGLLAQVAPTWKAADAPSSEAPICQGTLDIFSDLRVGWTNPSWYSLSPLALMDDGIPSGVRFLGEVKSQGFFRGEVAASAAHAMGIGTPQIPNTEALRQLEQSGKAASSEWLRSIGELAGVIRQAKEGPTVMSLLLKRTAESFSEAPVLLRDETARVYFESGKREMLRQAQGHIELERAIEGLLWDRYLLSDGLVESDRALRLCRRANARREDINRRCRSFELNHFAIAGFAKEAVDHVIDELR